MYKFVFMENENFIFVFEMYLANIRIALLFDNLINIILSILNNIIITYI